MARTLVIGADNTVGIQYLSIPDTNPVQYINGATITWSLQDLQGNILATGAYTAISDGTSEIQGAYTANISSSVTNTLVANNTYNLVQKVNASGFQSVWQDIYLAISSPSPDITYANRIDLENIFGANNIQRWADINNDGNAQTIDARILWSLVLSYSIVNSKLEGGIYKTPLQGSYPLIIFAQASLAAVKLYESRGLTNESADGQPVHQLSNHQKDALNVLSQIRAGVTRIPGVQLVDIIGTNIPQSIKIGNRNNYRGLWSGW